jgi:hypothetical protein
MAPPFSVGARHQATGIRLQKNKNLKPETGELNP